MKKLLILLCLFFGGCLTSGKRGGDAPMAVYDLGLPAAKAAASDRVPLGIEVRAPYWFDSLTIEYRLAYAEPARLREYALARWAGPPAKLLEQRLVQALGLLPAGQGGARCLVRLDVEEFSQVFASADRSQGILAVRATLLDRSRNRLAELSLKLEKSSPTPDSRGGVAALTAAVEQLALDLGSWRDELARAGRLQSCEK